MTSSYIKADRGVFRNLKRGVRNLTAREAREIFFGFLEQIIRFRWQFISFIRFRERSERKNFRFILIEYHILKVIYQFYQVPRAERAKIFWVSLDNLSYFQSNFIRFRDKSLRKILGFLRINYQISREAREKFLGFLELIMRLRLQFISLIWQCFFIDPEYSPEYPIFKNRIKNYQIFGKSASELSDVAKISWVFLSRLYDFNDNK